MNKKYCIMICAFIFYNSLGLFAAVDDIFKLNIKQLMHLKVETISKIKEDFTSSASAIYVITSDDIKRSGVTTLPDILRSVPGVDVVRVDNNKWGVAIRGFNGVFSNKLMVLIDGINIYNHLFAGVFWDIQSIPIETIERIEIIRGSSSTMWGANAVNGVINIITKKAANMRGLSLNASYGENSDDSFNIMLGKKLSNNLNIALDFNFQDYYKVDYKFLRDEPTYLKGLFKVEYSQKNNHIKLLSNLASAKTKNITQIPVKINGEPEAIIVDGRYSFDYQLYGFTWEHSFSEVNKGKLNIYYINSDIASYYNNPEKFVHRHINTRAFDVNFQNNIKYNKHNIVWGGEYRLDRDSNNRTDFNIGEKLNKNFNLYNFFALDKIALTKNLKFTIGSKYEYNDSISKGAFLSTIRVAYYPAIHTTLWFAFSNSVRTPSSLETDAMIPVINISKRDSTIVAKLFGNHDFDYEKLYTIEFGFKRLFSNNFYLDISFFYNHYRKLSIMSKGNLYKKDNYFILPLYFKNGMEGDVYGFEAWSKIEISKNLNLLPFYSYCYIDLNDHNNFRNESNFYKNSYPTFKIGTRLQLNLSKKIKFDSLIYYKDGLSYYKISDYTYLNMRFCYEPVKNLSLSISGQDLLKNKHREFTNELIQADNKIVRRSVLFNISYKY